MVIESQFCQSLTGEVPLPTRRSFRTIGRGSERIKWRGWDTLSTWNTFSFPPHIHQGGNIPLGGNTTSFGVRELIALTILPYHHQRWRAVMLSNPRSNAFTLTKPMHQPNSLEERPWPPLSHPLSPSPFLSSIWWREKRRAWWPNKERRCNDFEGRVSEEDRENDFLP